MAGLVGSSLTEPTDIDTLKQFWLRVRPFGFWSQVRQQVDQAVVQQARVANAIDVSNIILAVGWQLSSVVTVISLLLHKWVSATFGMSMFAILTGVLYVTWYRNLETKDSQL